jgi:DNA-directed RNA polymerase specialized sigma24 family protein
MSSSGSITALLDQLKAGNQEAARLMWERYYPRLVALARKKFQGAPTRVADEEDAVLSAFNSFCWRAERGQFPDLNDRDSLWALLVAITARKVADLLRYSHREKRGGGRVQGDSAVAASDSGGPAGFDGLPDDGPSPDEAALLADEVERLLSRIPDRALRQVATWKMEGYTNPEIATRMGCSLPTVERRLAIIRQLLQESS